MNTPSVYRFADCEVDPALRQVRRHGVAAEPQPKALDLLLYLIAHRDRVVDKDELLERIWPGVVVSESALTQALRKARAMVGDDGERQAVVRTIQRRGFRFVAELDDARGSAATPAPAAATKATPTTGPVAVLPFVDMSPAADQQYFCDGMAEEVINALAHAGQRVVARTSSFAFKNRPDDVRDIARKLGVSLVLEGSVRKAGERLRVTAQLVDAGSGFHVWSRTWDRRVEDMFAIQDEIAQNIATALGPIPSASAPPITAAELHRRGRTYQRRFGQRAQRFAIELFHQAIALDAKYAPAWAALALSYLLLYRYSFASEANRSEALAHAERALALDAKLSEAWAAKGAALTIFGDYGEADAAFRRAIALDPDSFEAHYFYARAATETGDFAKAANLFERAAAIDADDYQALVFASQCYRSLAQAERGRETERRALASVDRALAQDPTDARALVLSAAALIHFGNGDEARRRVERACSLEPDEPHCTYNAACAYALLGEHERALDLLEKLDVGTKANGSWMQHDVELDPLRGHPRFKAIMANTR
jgi:adenylate cyclase